MKIEAWPMHGPLNSKNIFGKLIQSMQKTGDNVSVNKETNQYGTGTGSKASL